MPKGRPKGSKNKKKAITDNSAPLVKETKPRAPRVSKNDGFKHGPCGTFWPIDADTCPGCSIKD